MELTKQRNILRSLAKSSADRLPRPVSVTLDQVAVRFASSRTAIRLRPLSFAAGSKSLIYGRSGLGKTTLLHLMAGLLPPDQGRVHLGDLDLYQAAEWHRSRIRRHDIGIIFQTLNLLEHLSARENVLLTLDRGNNSQNLAREQLQRVGLADHEHTVVSQLSLGQRQRVAVARILAQRPALILADEPTSSLDDDHAQAVMDALLQASSEATLIMVSHDQRFRSRLDRAINIEEVLQQ